MLKLNIIYQCLPTSVLVSIIGGNLLAPKRHHYLPQFYLRGFLKHNRNQLTVIKIDDGNFFQTDTKNVGIETDWNRVCDDRSSAEEYFAEIDGKTSRILKDIFEGKILPTEEDDRILLLYFVARLSVHNPIIRNVLQKFQTDTSNHLGRWWTSSPGIYYEKVKSQDADKLIPYEHMKRFIEEEAYEINFDHGYFLKHETEFIQETLIPMLYNLNWSLLIVKDPTESFVCSDRPVFMNPMFSQLPGETEFIPDFSLTLPLSKQMCLYGDRLGIVPEIYNIYKEDGSGASTLSVPFLNSRTIYGAQRHVYAGDLNWEIGTATGGKRDANSLIGKRIRDVIDAWYNAYHFDDDSLKNMALDSVRS